MELNINIAPPIWRVVSASVRGTAHERTGEPCQDAHRWCVLPDGTLIAALADGAGCASFADVGAELAVQSAIEATQRLLRTGVPSNEDGWNSLLVASLREVKTVIEQKAVELDVEVRELASTLITLIATPETIAVAQIGDGAAVAGTDCTLETLTAPLLGEYLNETTFLGSANAIQNAQIQVSMVKAARVALLSDGLQMLALRLPGGQPHPQFFDPFFEFTNRMGYSDEASIGLAKWMNSPRVTGRTDDDLTLVVAVRRE